MNHPIHIDDAHPYTHCEYRRRRCCRRRRCSRCSRRCRLWLLVSVWLSRMHRQRTYSVAGSTQPYRIRLEFVVRSFE